MRTIPSITELFKSGRLHSAVFARMDPADVKKVMKIGNGNSNSDLAKKVNAILAEAAEKLAKLCDGQGSNVRDEALAVAMSQPGRDVNPILNQYYRGGDLRVTSRSRARRRSAWTWGEDDRSKPRL